MSWAVRLLWICLAVACIALSSLWKRRKELFVRRALLGKHICKEPPTMLNINLAKVISESNREYRYLETIVGLFATCGSTHKVFHLGRTDIRTCGLGVVKAVYSTRFGKFGLQPIRYCAYCELGLVETSF